MKIPIGYVVLISILVAIAVWAFLEYAYVPSKTVSVTHRRKYDIVTLRLPNSHDPDIFGPSYWKSFHALAEMVPCPACRYKAVPFMKFFHDIVNSNTGKKIYDSKNYNYWLEYISKKEKA